MSHSKTEQSTRCTECNDTGSHDSGGFDEAGRPINVPCWICSVVGRAVCPDCNGRGCVLSPAPEPWAVLNEPCLTCRENGWIAIDPPLIVRELPGGTTAEPVNCKEEKPLHPNPSINPFTVVVDTREQHPYTFTGFSEDAAKQYRPLVVHTSRQGLQSGDYAIQGLELQCSIERKSLPDLFGTLIGDRERFERELDRLNQMMFAAVIVEAGWEAIWAGPQRPGRTAEQSRIVGKTMYRSIIAYSIRYPRVHWFPMPDRQSAERTTFRLLQRFWKDMKDAKRGAV